MGQMAFLLCCALAGFLSSACHEVRAESYPDRPIRLIVPFTPAGATDMLARIVGEGLSRRLGQPVTIENRPGAGGNIGAALAARARADGYTLLMAPTSIMAIAMTLYPTPGYDLAADFQPVATIANAPHVLVVDPTLQVHSLNALLERARRQPDTIVFASQGVGTVSHLELALLEQLTGTRFVHVPYKGSSPALVDLLGGRVSAMFDSIASALPHIRTGRLQPLAVAPSVRTSALPQVATVAELGVDGYRAESWLGILVPVRTPMPIVLRLSRELEALLADAAVRPSLVDRGFEPQWSTPAQFAARIRGDISHWRKVVRGAKLQMEE